MHVAFIVQGLFAISDSVGYDCIFQYELLSRNKELFPEITDIEIFSEKYLAERYANIPIKSIDKFFQLAQSEKPLLIIYHFCDGWPTIDRYLLTCQHRVIVRWHNNTPPWFYLRTAPEFARNTVRGFENVVSLFKNPRITWVTNSDFSKRQLLALGGCADALRVVYPGSRYLKDERHDRISATPVRDHHNFWRLLFVGRIVHHKGHRNILHVAEQMSQLLQSKVHVDFAGRSHGTFYVDELRRLANDIGVSLSLHGEVDERELLRLYTEADVFICLSEHEGFGMPIFEAMRCGIPVVAWKATAFAELLDDHPLAFSDFNIDTFARAVISLNDDSVRAAVLEQQKKILERYTKKVVFSQFYEVIKELCQPCVDWTARCAPNQNIIYDSPQNLVSLYDLENYKEYFKWKFPAEESADWLSFVVPGPAGKRRGNSICSKIGKKDYMIVTPDIALRQGDYVFRLSLTSRSGFLDRIRVALAGKREVCVCEVWRGDSLIKKEAVRASELRKREQNIKFALEQEMPSCGRLSFRILSRGHVRLRLAGIHLVSQLNPSAVIV
jgi:glycosyltransferase involved in cell wall biosynthesis